MCGPRGALPLGKGMPGREPSGPHLSREVWPSRSTDHELARSCRLGNIRTSRIGWSPEAPAPGSNTPNCSSGGPSLPGGVLALPPSCGSAGIPTWPEVPLLLKRRAPWVQFRAPGGDPGGELSYTSWSSDSTPRAAAEHRQGATGLWEVRRKAPEFSGPSVPGLQRTCVAAQAGHRTAHLKVCHDLLHLGPADVQETLDQVPVDEAGGRFCLPLRVKGPPGGGVKECAIRGNALTSATSWTPGPGEETGPPGSLAALCTTLEPKDPGNHTRPNGSQQGDLHHRLPKVQLRLQGCRAGGGVCTPGEPLLQAQPRLHSSTH